MGYLLKKVDDFKQFLGNFEKNIVITIWVAYDYRHSYNLKELCETCKKSKKLFSDHEVFKLNKAKQDPKINVGNYEDLDDMDDIDIPSEDKDPNLKFFSKLKKN